MICSFSSSQESLLKIHSASYSKTLIDKSRSILAYMHDFDKIDASRTNMLAK